MEKVNAINYLLSQIQYGYNNKDIDCISSHLRDLTYWLDEQGLLGE